MRLLVISALFVVVLAAGKKRSDAILEERQQQMSEWSQHRPVIKLTSDRFNNFVKPSAKPYHVVVMFTALKTERGCSFCKQASDEFTIVANSWHYLSPQQPEPLFFALADFDDCQELFSSMKINQVPKYVVFPPNGKPQTSDSFDLQSKGYDAEAIAKWVSERTDQNIRVFRPPNYSGTVLLVLLVLAVGVLLYLRRNSLDFFFSRHTWSIIVLGIIFTMISGQMWNTIRGPPFMHRNPSSGAIGYFSGSTQYQFIAETYIVLFLYAACTVGMILLSEVDRCKDAGKSRVFAIVGIGMVCFFFSFILSIFRSKYQGYPYSFLFK